MADTITIRTSTERDVVKVVERGPQGASSGGGSGSVTSVALASSDLTITGSPITTSGTITANLANSGATAGTYTKVTVDAKGRVTAGATATAAEVGAAQMAHTHVAADITDLQTNGNAAGLWDADNSEQLVSTGDGELHIRKTGTALSGALNASVLSANRGYNLPDASGTLALTTTVVDNADGLWDSANSVTGATVADYELSITDGTNVSSLTFPVGASRNYTFPNASGTVVVSDISAGSGSDVVNNIVSLTQAEYDAISSKDASTLYLITDP